jgi:hypothetical protein
MLLFGRLDGGKKQCGTLSTTKIITLLSTTSTHALSWQSYHFTFFSLSRSLLHPCDASRDALSYFAPAITVQCSLAARSCGRSTGCRSPTARRRARAARSCSACRGARGGEGRSTAPCHGQGRSLAQVTDGATSMSLHTRDVPASARSLPLGSGSRQWRSLCEPPRPGVQLGT